MARATARRRSRPPSRPCWPFTNRRSTPGIAAPTGPVKFPSKIDPKYSAEKPSKQRMQTCLDQYNANKAGTGAGNGGLKWIQKGGGYYSECNKRLKG